MVGPSTRSIAVRSYRFISRTRWWIVRTSKGSVGSVGFSGMPALRDVDAGSVELGCRRRSRLDRAGPSRPIVRRHSDRVERLGDVGQDLAAVGGHQHVVLDPDAAPAGQVDARLDRDDHARLGA